MSSLLKHQFSAHQEIVNESSRPISDLPFILHTDASQKCLGAVFYQHQAGELQVIGYGSHTLTNTEKKLSSTYRKTFGFEVGKL